MPEGRSTAFHVFVQDITDRKEVEAALLSEVTQRTRERDRLWETTNDLMGTAGLDGFLKRASNPAWARMLGWTEAELLGRPFADVHRSGRPCRGAARWSGGSPPARVDGLRRPRPHPRARPRRS